MIVLGLSIAGVSFAIAALIILAAMHHPTGGDGSAKMLPLCGIGIVGGISLAFVGALV